MSWDPPLRLNGILTAYLVKHWRNDSLPSSGQTTRLSNITLSHTVTGLGANTAYVVEVSAETRVGASTSKRLVAKTTESPGKQKLSKIFLYESRKKIVMLFILLSYGLTNMSQGIL